MCTRVTSFALVLQVCTRVTEELHSFLSQSELSNFFVYIIRRIIKMRHLIFFYRSLHHISESPKF